MKDVFTAFDSYLERKGLHFEAVIIGGAALIVMEVVDRQTKDVDCLDPLIDAHIKEASIEFSKEHPHLRLQKNWLNNGPSSLDPSIAELQECYSWVIKLDENPLWPEHVLESFKILGRRRGYEFNP